MHGTGMADGIGRDFQHPPQGGHLQLVELLGREDRRRGGRLEEGHVEPRLGHRPAEHGLVLGQPHEHLGKLFRVRAPHPGKDR